MNNNYDGATLIVTSEEIAKMIKNRKLTKAERRRLADLYNKLRQKEAIYGKE